MRAARCLVSTRASTHPPLAAPFPLGADNVDKSEKLAEFLRLEAIAKADAFQGPRLELERVAEELETKNEALREWKGSGTVWET